MYIEQHCCNLVLILAIISIHEINMTSSSEEHYQTDDTTVLISRTTRVVLKDVSMNNIQIWRDSSSRSILKLSLNISADEMIYIRREIEKSLSFMNANATNAKCCDINLRDNIISGDQIVKIPIIKHAGVLTSKNIKLSEYLDNAADMNYFRGLFDLTIMVITKELNGCTNVLGFIVTHLNIGSEQMRHMGDCVFPDYFTDIGEDSVSREYLNSFMKTY